MGHYFTETFLQSMVQAAAVLGSTAAVFYLYFTTLSYYFNVEYQFVSRLSDYFAANLNIDIQTLGNSALTSDFLAIFPGYLHLRRVFSSLLHSPLFSVPIIAKNSGTLKAQSPIPTYRTYRINQNWIPISFFSSNSFLCSPCQCAHFL
jgi:hypothetical protein